MITTEHERESPFVGSPSALRDWGRLFAQLAAFHFAAQEGSIQGGARRMGLNRNSLARYLEELEQASGVRLRDADSETRGLALTEAGRHLAQLLDPLFSRLETVSAQLMGGLQELRLGCQSSTSSYLLPGWMQAFGAERKRLRPQESDAPRFSLKTGSTELILNALKGLEVDVGIIATDDERERIEGGVSFFPLFKEALLAICPKNHRFSRAGAVPAREFVRDSHYLYYLGGERYQEHINGLAPGEGASRLMEFDTIQAIKETVRAGLGISIIPGGAIREEDRSWLSIVPLEVSPKRSRLLMRYIAIVVREHDDLTPLAGEFVRFIQTHRRQLIGG